MCEKVPDGEIEAKYKTLPPTALAAAKEEAEAVEAWTTSEEVELKDEKKLHQK